MPKANPQETARQELIDIAPEAIRGLMEHLGYNTTEFASELGCAESTVRQWLRGEAGPGYRYIRRMMDRFGVKPEVFFRGPRP